VQAVCRGLKLCQSLGQSVQQFIEVLTKLYVQIQIKDSEYLLVLKFNYGLLNIFCKEVSMFDITITCAQIQLWIT
jgi:hypothetical protein